MFLRNKITLIIAIALTLITTTIYAGGRHVYDSNTQLIIRDKIAQFSDPYQIQQYYVPASSLGLPYYYAIRSEAELEREANLIAKKVIDQLFELGVLIEGEEPAKDGDNGATGEEPTDNEQVDVDSSEVEHLLVTNCKSCHEGKTAKKGFTIVVDDILNQNLTLAQKVKILDRVEGIGLKSEKLMPLNGEPLSDEEVNLIRNWVRESLYTQN